MKKKKVNVIFSIDPTTAFLSTINKTLKEAGVGLNVIEIHPSNESYVAAINMVRNLPRNSIILFLGHGQDNQLFGGESETFKKDVFIKDTEMNIFYEQFLFLLACNSSDLLKRSFRLSKIKNSIGFGALPTEMSEIEKNRKLNAYITKESVIKFGEALVDLVSTAFIEFYKKEEPDFIWLKDYLGLLINKKINQAVLEENDNGLADLLFNMKQGLKMF